MLSTMKRGTGGRPSLGYAKDYKVRLRDEASSVVEADCEAAQTSYQNYLEAVIAIGLRHLDELPAHLLPREVLPEAG